MPFNAPIPNPQLRPKKPSALSSLVEAEKMMQIAVLLPVSAFVGWGIGAWLDKSFHQSWIALAGIIVGGFAGLLYVIRLVIDAGGKSKSGTGPSATKP